MLKELIKKNRSFRRFVEDERLDENFLRELVELARFSATGGNAQPLKFMLSCDNETNEKIFPYLAWAGGLPDWDGPEKGERPAAYILILGDTDIANGFGVNHGIAAQSMLLGAVNKDYGGCMLGAIKRKGLRLSLDIPERFEILLVLALGKPAEKVVVDKAEPGDDVTYWRDDDDVHHVPKRSLNELIVEF